MKISNLHGMYKPIIIKLAIAILIISLPGCLGTQDTVSTPSQYSALYNPSQFSINSDFQIYHISDDLSSLYIRLFTKELLFSEANPQAEYRALVDINLLMYELDEEGTIVARSDSITFRLKLDRDDEASTAFFTSKVITVKSGKQYMMRIETKDVQRGANGLQHLYIDKRDKFSAQNFSVVSARTGYPRFLDYMSEGEIFQIKYRVPGYDSIFLDYFRNIYDLPRPMLTVGSPSFYEQIPDTTYRIPWNDSTIFTLPDRGMYHFRVDSLNSQGVTLHNFGPDFPQVKSETSLLEPTFYIATLTEYSNLRDARNLKRAIDEFWLQRTNSVERSRELIRIYYNRVLYSNLYFTSNREGWKTDRGMVFILFGPPDRIKLSAVDERWYYISRKQGRVIEFIFNRVPGQYSNHDLIWKKNTQTMQYVSSAVSSWRAGKVFSLGK